MSNIANFTELNGQRFSNFTYPSLSGFRFAQFHFILKATSSFKLPPYKGSVFRGCFGKTLKRVACSVNGADCGSCTVRSGCAYFYIFETRQNHGGCQDDEQMAPHPFIIIPPLSTVRHYSPGDLLDLNIVLVGRGIDYLPYFIFSIIEMGKRGIGSDYGKFAVSTVQSVRPFGTVDHVYLSESGRIDYSGPPIIIEDIIPALDNHDSGRIELEFITPARLISRGKLVDSPGFSVLIRCLLRRIAALMSFHHDCALEIDYKGLVEKSEKIRLAMSSLRWLDWERYSNRQQTRMKLGGIVGRVEYEGDILPFLPFIGLGEHIHVGKNTGFGLGKYRIVRALEDGDE